MIMHDATPYGHLALGEQPMNLEYIARKAGCTVDELGHLLGEIEQAGVPSRTPNGIIFNRRMVRDHAARSSHVARQQSYRARRPRDGPVDGSVDASLTPLFSLQSSEGKKKEEDKTPQPPAAAGGMEIFAQKPGIPPAKSRSESRKWLTLDRQQRALKAQIASLEKAQDALRSQYHSDACGWAWPSDAVREKWNGILRKIKQLETQLQSLT